MSNSFIPRAYQPQAPVPEKEPVQPVVTKRPDKVGAFLVKISQFTVVALAFLLPILFIPGLGATLGFTKVMTALTLGLATVIFAALAALRFKSAKTVVPVSLLIFWGVVIIAFASALLSGDTLDAIRGSFFGPQTAGFMAVMALVMTLPLLLQRSKIMVLYTLAAFASSIGILLLYNLVRFFAGPILPFGSFGQVTSSPAGGINDLAVFAAVTVVVGFITLLQLPLKNWMKAGVLGLIFASLLVLMVANFFLLWIIVGFFALLFLIYILSRDTLFGETVEDETNNSPLLIVASLVVCVVAILFVVAGDFAGARINAITGVNYIEVRPSMSATLDMVKSEYQEDILLGSGPNRFADVWRVHKDQSINQTNFWNVNFEAGFGLIPTLFVTLGLLGGVLLFAFHASYLYAAYRALLRSDDQDSFWFYAGSASFTAAIILWIVTYFYVPGSAVLLLTALFTGLSFVAYGALVPSAAKTIPLAANRRRGLLLMAIAVILVVVSVSTIFTVGKQYSAQATFTQSAQTAESVEAFEAGVQKAYQLYPDDRFLNALNQLKISQLRALLSVSEPSEQEQARFAALAQQSIALAQEAAGRDNTSPQAYIALADIYNILDRAGLEGARQRTLESIDAAQSRDPINPSYALSRAYISATDGDYETARGYIQESLSLKSNFTSALFLLSQISIEEGDVEAAITATRQVVTFEPNNPTRYYQLGILLAANEQYDEAIAAYQAALQLDSNYANARYMLGLALVAQGNTDAALVEFRTVQANNTDNEQLGAIIAEIESTGGLRGINMGFEEPVGEAQGAENTEDGVVASSTPQTDLISPVNTEAAPEQSNEQSDGVE